MRVRSIAAKVGIVVVALALAWMATIVLAVANNISLAYVVNIAAVVGIVLLSARVFRGSKESSAPRPYWQMTSTVATSILFAVLFAISAVGTLMGAWGSRSLALYVVGALVLLVVAAAYSVSAFRLNSSAASPRSSRS